MNVCPPTRAHGHSTRVGDQKGPQGVSRLGWPRDLNVALYRYSRIWTDFGTILSEYVLCEAYYHFLLLCIRCMAYGLRIPVPTYSPPDCPPPNTLTSRTGSPRRACVVHLLYDLRTPSPLRSPLFQDAFVTTESFWSAVFCFAQLAYVITTTYKSMRTCAARVYPASGPFWARDGRYSISSAVTAGDDEASPGRV